MQRKGIETRQPSVGQAGSLPNASPASPLIWDVQAPPLGGNGCGLRHPVLVSVQQPMPTNTPALPPCPGHLGVSLERRVSSFRFCNQSTAIPP